MGSATFISLLLAPLASVSVCSSICCPFSPTAQPPPLLGSAGGKEGAGDSAQCHCPAPLPIVLRKRLVGLGFFLNKMENVASAAVPEVGTSR